MSMSPWRLSGSPLNKDTPNNTRDPGSCLLGVRAGPTVPSTNKTKLTLTLFLAIQLVV